MSYHDVESAIFEASGAESTLNSVNHARNLGQSIAEGTATGADGDALALLQSDIAEIRQSLAFELRLTSKLPETLAKTIATSEDPDVAGPFLESSPVVTEAFILDIISDLGTAGQSAVAKRPDVSDAVAEALVDCGNEKALLTLARNDKAEIAAAILTSIAAKFPNNARLCRTVQKACEHVKRLPEEAQSVERQLPFNVLVSRARAFQKNGMLTAAYIEGCFLDAKLDEAEAALCVLSDIQRKDVRAALLKSDDTRRALEQKCALAPGTLNGNVSAILAVYTRP
ncbi:MAG: DUF2336 domain-containing protein [Pseudomonadota bacterium]